MPVQLLKAAAAKAAAPVKAVGQAVAHKPRVKLTVIVVAAFMVAANTLHPVEAFGLVFIVIIDHSGTALLSLLLGNKADE